MTSRRLATRFGLVLLAAALLAPPLRADAFDDGLVAYIEGDYERARRLWLEAAELDIVEAQFNLALLHETGLGDGADQTGDVMRADLLEAAYWYSQAARRGFLPAQFNLGSLFYSGRGVPRDVVQAAGWWTQAARAGFAKAQLNLGVLYLRGLGVALNPIRARYWLELAAEQGLETARLHLQALPPVPEGTNELADVRGSEWVLEQKPAYMTARLQTLATFDEALDFVEEHGLGPVAAVVRDESGRWEVVGGVFDSLEAGRQALSLLTPELQALAPRLESFAELEARLTGTQPEKIP